ncbi:hypothetical protein F2P81_017997 [Scophthalmus maximus]|uniref:Uncharacterized protein n=1 Tax=Scophthalmus maximus TaxID=52904 RepID=A0A6A4SED4_SCOMX|nr:hypothetical protein F2P81_017997 [Scophthalmus maximus]
MHVCFNCPGCPVWSRAEHQATSLQRALQGLFRGTRGEPGAVSSSGSVLLQTTLWTTSELRQPRLQSGVSRGHRRQQGDCPTCRQMIRQRCHCKISLLYVECTKLTLADKQTKVELGSCNNQCPKEEELEAFEKRQQRGGGRRSKKRGRREEVEDERGRARRWWRRCSALVLVPLGGALLSAAYYYLMTTT